MKATFSAQISIAILAMLALPHVASGQGSVGGSIGVQEKSISGDRAPPARAVPPPSRKQSAPEPRRVPPPARGGGNYDGVWMVVNVGCGGGTGAVTVAGGRVIGGGVTGTVSSSGAVRTVSASSVGSGRISGRSASGSFRTNDGCVGRWSAVKQ